MTEPHKTLTALRNMLGEPSRSNSERNAIKAKIRELEEQLGLKLGAFARGAHRWLASSDSMAWSFTARRQPPLPGCTHKNCANCLPYALRWREQVLAMTTAPAPRQMELFDAA